MFVLVYISLSVSFSVTAEALTLLEDRQTGKAGSVVRSEGWCVDQVVVRRKRGVVGQMQHHSLSRVGIQM